MTSVRAGLFISEGLPTTAPHKLGTTSQSSWRFGWIPSFRPINDPATTTAPAEAKSGGICIRSETSTIHPREGSGTIVGPRGAAGGRTSGNGTGSSHSPSSLGALRRSATAIGSRSRPLLGREREVCPSGGGKAHRSAQERQTLREAKATREAQVVQKRFQVQSGDGGKDQRTQSCLRAGFVPRSRRGRDAEVGRMGHPGAQPQADCPNTGITPGRIRAKGLKP